IEAPAGEYYAYALTVGTEMAGLYAQADHTLRPFQVESGQTTAEINLCDWNNPPGIIPAGSATTQIVTVSTLQKMHVFSGPGLDYALLGPAPARATAPALGRNPDSSWLQIEYPTAGGNAWIYAPLVQIAGQPTTLPVVLPEADPAQTKGAKLEPSKNQFSPTAWSVSFNESVVHFKGFITDEAGQPVNGFSILADNGTWSVLSHPTGASHWYPDTDDGEWDIIITNATDAVGWWTLTVVSYDCPDFEGGFNAQCKQFTRLSENQLVKIVYPDETIIEADWVCHNNCDRGLYVKAYRP
ncbi:MAG TPA: hypothetical protein VEC93_02730, partial [Anaerolineae bacterium]|nr:hypothetical protein [Anaerolineae bacterium]